MPETTLRTRTIYAIREVEVVLGQRFDVRDDELIIASRPSYNGRHVITIVSPRDPPSTATEVEEANT